MKENVYKSKPGFYLAFKKDLVMHKYVYLMLIPVVLYYIVFHYIPMGGLVIAFQQFSPGLGYFKSPWVGIDNFVKFLTGPYSLRLIRNTLLINVYEIIFQFPMPIIFALFINEVRNNSYKRIVQTISYMPHFVSMVVMCGILVTFSRSDGVLTNLVVLFGGERADLLTKVEWYRSLYIGSEIWKSIGWGSIIYISTLSNVDQNLYEAAEIDGAGRFRKMVSITVPSLLPIITIQLIMRLGHIMSQGFEKAILIYNPLTYEVSDIISTYVYRRGLEMADYSFGAAVGMFNSIINLILLVMANKISKVISQESLW